MNNKITFINVAGFFGSGSSAVVDLLKEFKDFYECDAEIRFIKDPGGLCDLETALLNHWDLINSAAAIVDFRKMIKKGCRHGRHFWSPAGMGYAHNISKNFMALTDEYITKLTNYTYIGDFYHFKFQKPYLKYLLDRYRTAIEYYSKGKFRTGNRSLTPLHFSHPSSEQFYEATQWFMEAIFAERVRGKDNPYIILDQAVSPSNTQVIHKYFKNSKLIIVDRDPRDMFANEYRWGCYLDNDYNEIKGGHNFAIRQRALRDTMVFDKDVLYIKFEDLIVDYDNTKAKIMEFVGLTEVDHLCPKKFLKPEVSIKNIGLWQKYHGELGVALDVIGEELPDLCYDLNKIK